MIEYDRKYVKLKRITMKMTKKVMTAIGVLALLAGMTMNAQYALDDYGMYGKRLVKFVLAQTSTTSTSSSTTKSTTNSNSDPNEAAKKKCSEYGGIWNTYSKCTGGGISPVTCTIERQISIGGSLFVGGYKKNKTYTVAWELYSCEKLDNSCCTFQGIKIKSVS
jgi:hypothetical protein